MIDPQATLILDRFCFDAAAIAVYGRSGFVAWAAPQALGQALAEASRRWTLAASMLALLAASAWLPLEAATSLESWGAAMDSGILLSLAFDSQIGTSWLVRAGLALILLLVVSWRLGSRWTHFAAALLLASLALSGHARMDSGWRGVLHVVNDVVHLLSGGAWLGSLLILPLCLARLRDPMFAADARSALEQFSKAGHLAVALVVATGVINAILIMPGWPLDLRSTYWMLLTIKVCLVIAMTGLALVNRYVLVPRMRTQRERTIIQIEIGTLAELVLGVGVLLLVSTFGIMDPS